MKIPVILCLLSLAYVYAKSMVVQPNVNTPENIGGVQRNRPADQSSAPKLPNLVRRNNEHSDDYFGAQAQGPFVREVIVQDAYYRKDNSVIIQWDSEVSNILGFRVVYRLSRDKSFKLGPPLAASEREFKIKNVPTQECIVVCVVSLEDVTITPENVENSQCRELSTETSGASTHMDTIIIAASAAIGGTASTEESYVSSKAKYDFEWNVSDENSENHYGHKETRDGDDTQGSYYVRLPDGRLQIVQYQVDGDNGYVANVEYIGEFANPLGRSNLDDDTQGSFSVELPDGTLMYAQLPDGRLQTYAQLPDGRLQTITFNSDGDDIYIVNVE